MQRYQTVVVDPQTGKQEDKGSYIHAHLQQVKSRIEWDAFFFSFLVCNSIRNKWSKLVCYKEELLITLLQQCACTFVLGLRLIGLIIFGYQILVWVPVPHEISQMYSHICKSVPEGVIGKNLLSCGLSVWAPSIDSPLTGPAAPNEGFSFQYSPRSQGLQPTVSCCSQIATC